MQCIIDIIMVFLMNVFNLFWFVLANFFRYTVRNITYMLYDTFLRK